MYCSPDSIIRIVPKLFQNYFSELQTSNKQAEPVLSISHTTQRRRRWKKRGRMTDRADSPDSAEGRSYCPEIVLYLGKCAPKIARFRGLNFSFLSVWLRARLARPLKDSMKNFAARLFKHEQTTPNSILRHFLPTAQTRLSGRKKKTLDQNSDRKYRINR